MRSLLVFCTYMVTKPYLMVFVTTILAGVKICLNDPLSWKPLKEVFLSPVVTMDSCFFIPKSFSRFLATEVVNLN